MRKWAYAIYPFIVFLGLFAGIRHEAEAGEIRRLELTPDRSAVIRLAFGRTTAISFASKPEKVVPGSPEAIEVNFLGKDITVRPLSARPGNLLIYTKSARYVLLLQVTGEGAYDDVVKVNSGSGKMPLRLSEDTFRIATYFLSEEGNPPISETREVPVMVFEGGRTIASQELRDALLAFPHLVCNGCVARWEREDGITLSCSKPVREIHCRSLNKKLILRGDPS